MDPDKTFLLKWNDFQQNISSTIRNLRMDLDFLDVTIFCSGVQVKAHKVILSACSNIFKGILKDAPSPHPVIVLWDVEEKDLQAILDFMYNGQVDIRQEDLESFLAAAGRLQVQGLSGEEKVNGGAGAAEKRSNRKRSIEPESRIRSMKPTKLGRKMEPDHLAAEEQNLVVHDMAARELVIHDVPIKEEVPEEVVNNQIHPREAHTGPVVEQPAAPEYRVAEYSTETVEYPEEYADREERENYYEDESSYTSVQYPLDYSCPGLENSPGKSTKSVKCPYCDKVLKYRHNLKGHIQNQHGDGEPEAPCPICPDKTFKNAASLRDHMSRKHKTNNGGVSGSVAAKQAALALQQSSSQQQHAPQGTLAHS